MKVKQFPSNWLFYIILYIFFVYFFSSVHPIVPFDSDDWLNSILERPSYPSLDYWNPTKVFPERFEPFVSTLAGYLIVPIVGDYISGLIFGNAIVVTLFILFYLFSVQKYIESRFYLSRLTTHTLIIIFVLFHFIILRSSAQCNEHLWYSNDSNCYYHYIIPHMLCACLVLWLMQHNIRNVRCGRTIATLLVMTYLALCSNLYSVVILIAYIGAVLLLDLKTTKLTSYIRRNSPYLIVIILWGIIQLMESSGKRANTYGFLHKPLIHSLAVTIYHFLTIRYNLWFLFVAFLTLVGVKWHEYKRHRSLLYIDIHGKIFILAFCLSATYLILLSSRVNPGYIQRGDVIFEFAFFFFLLLIIAIAYLFKHFKHFWLAAPLLLIFMLFQINTSGRTFKDVCEQYPPNLQGSILFDKEVVRQTLDAEAAGQDSVVINVPKYKDSENWPIATIGNKSEYYGIAFYKHNLTKRIIKTIFIPSYEIEE